MLDIFIPLSYVPFWDNTVLFPIWFQDSIVLFPVWFQDSIVDATEESQIAAAIQASMKQSIATITLSSDSDSEFNSDCDLETFTDSDEPQSDAEKGCTLSKGKGSSKRPSPCKSSVASSPGKRPGKSDHRSAVSTFTDNRKVLVKTSASCNSDDLNCISALSFGDGRSLGINARVEPALSESTASRPSDQDSQSSSSSVAASSGTSSTSSVCPRWREYLGRSTGGPCMFIGNVQIDPPLYRWARHCTGGPGTVQVSHALCRWARHCTLL